MPSKGIFLAAHGSNGGKTCATIGLIAALRARGVSVQAAKAGPDFIDAAWLAMASQKPCPNLDLFMGANGGWLRCWRRFVGAGDFTLVEGAMGLFDGDGAGLTSGALLAQELGLPVLLLLNARGIGQSIAAIAHGFLHYQPSHLARPPRFCGIVCAHVGSGRHWDILAAALRPVCEAAGVPLLGYLPTADAPNLESRHLGLKQACECSLDLTACEQWFCRHVDLDTLWRNCDCVSEASEADKYPPADVTVAIARDEAFAFCYADLPLLLAELGAETVFFSPLRDSEAPACDAIYIPGGYPELYGERLAANGKMLEAIKRAARRGIPIFGECGGCMYLMEVLVDGEGRRWSMLGLLSGEAAMGSKLAALGYRTAESACWDGKIYGHEFHYARGIPGPDASWRVRNVEDRLVEGIAGQRGPVTGTWMHLYPEGTRPFWRHWLALARARKKGWS